MEENILKKQGKQLLVLEAVTHHCKICFKEIKGYTPLILFHPNNILCKECSNSLKAKFIRFKIFSHDALAIYEYDDTIRKLIYTYKGCYDYELKDVFLYRYIHYLRIIYKGYIVIPVPSNKIDDQIRGFNHVEEIYKALKLPMEYLLKKVSREKQSSLNKKNRLKIENKFIIENEEKIRNKKVLIVDDIYTTGATMRKAISLVKGAKPKSIKILVIAKTIDLEKRKN